MTVFDVRHRTATVDGWEVFYREAGDPANPTLVLLHGFPSSSHMYRYLLAELSDRFHLIAPDYLGFGNSAAPTVDEFAYSFDALADIVQGLLNQLGVARFAIYVQDYGAPIGWRLASREPAQVTALITQNGNAYEEGFTPFWDVLWAHAKDRETHADAAREALQPKAIHWQYTHGVPADRLDRIAPETWQLDQAGLDRPGNDAIQLQLFWDYQFNVQAYPTFQQYFRDHQPPALVVWGGNDEIFAPAGAEAFRRDLPDAQIHLLDAGHFALETHGAEIADLIRGFLTSAVKG
ncbi:alpha/beta fold hydrolase [Mycolicibacterium vaccae]|uniref:alpha/beta fold hydrolase n=1 Tax=Mycolicibacterium vaccae TaxID=1810 RepID=UPI003D0522EB